MTLYLVTAESADTLALHRPKLILPIGSGGAGKSFWCRWFIERAAKRGAPLDVYDADPLSPARAPLPRHADRFDHAPRFGLIEWFAHTPVALAAEELGLDFVAVYLLVPDPDSLPRLPYFLDLIKAPRTVIVLNEWRTGADEGASAFADIIADPRIAAARADGARIITMPHLPAPNRLDAFPSHNPRRRNPALSDWLKCMEDNFAPVAAWFD
jgi:hypothetical protein